MCVCVCVCVCVSKAGQGVVTYSVRERKRERGGGGIVCVCVCVKGGSGSSDLFRNASIHTYITYIHEQYPPDASIHTYIQRPSIENAQESYSSSHTLRHSYGSAAIVCYETRNRQSEVDPDDCLGVFTVFGRGLVLYHDKTVSVAVPLCCMPAHVSGLEQQRVV